MNHVEFRFNAIMSNVAFARTTVCAFLAPLNPTLEELADIKTLVSEAVSNAIIHGYKLNASRFVFVKVTTKENNVEIIIQDYGVGIDNVEQALTPSYTTNVEDEHAGMGFTIMQALSDNFEIKSSLGLGTRLVINKELSGYLLGVE